MPLKDPLQRDYCTDGQHPTLERADAARAYRLDAVRAHGAFPKAEETIAQELATLRDAQRMSPALVMRDPYILDFLGLRDTWQEGDLEAAIIREMVLPAGAGRGLLIRRPAEAHSDRRRGFPP